ncbi:hypothetical protein G7Y89_g9908 [Cudoniella acicularis]|uniref:Uncharacterized protein n=1 Tax=Cudoniella acicularis TaxID=354080 RepID=A0A8H4RES4_9HELO|nr:hypothetical protein G7Y89_g9908 [Cudoniella acicularis]
MAPQKIFLGDLEASWKWPRRTNPHTLEIKQECLEWVASFRAFTPEAQKAFDKCNFNEYTPRTSPRGIDTEEESRSPDRTIISLVDKGCACSLMNLFFIFDEHSDKSEAAEVWNQVDIIMDALRNPSHPRPEGEWVGGEVARQ